MFKQFSKIFATVSLSTVLATGLLAATAEAGGLVYQGQRTDAIKGARYLACYETQYGDIYELTYEKMTSLDQNGVDYMIRATGVMAPEHFVVYYADKNGGDDAGSIVVPQAMYPIKYQKNGGIIIGTTEHFPGADKFLEYSVPGQYDFGNDMLPLASPNACRLFLETLPKEMTDIYLEQVSAQTGYYKYESTGFSSNIHDDYPSIDSQSMGRVMDVYFVEKGKEQHVGTYLIDARLENMWRIDYDGSIAHLYTAGAVG